MKSYHVLILVVLVSFAVVFAKLMGDQRSKEPKGPIKIHEEIENNSPLIYHGKKIFYSDGMKYVIYLPEDPRRTTLIVNLTKDSLECEYYRNHIKP